jgi:hypothetical protein
VVSFETGFLSTGRPFPRKWESIRQTLRKNDLSADQIPAFAGVIATPSAHLSQNRWQNAWRSNTIVLHAVQKSVYIF